jgi:hypothetical protein
MDEAKVTIEQPKLVSRFREYIRTIDYQFDDDRVESVLDYLYVAYTENQGRDPKEIEQGFVELDDYLKGISLDDNNAIFSLVCRLCDLYEQRAFKDALQLGAHLILELRGN